MFTVTSEYKKEVENKTLLKQIVPGDEYANTIYDLVLLLVVQTATIPRKSVHFG